MNDLKFGHDNADVLFISLNYQLHDILLTTLLTNRSSSCTTYKLRVGRVGMKRKKKENTTKSKT